ncbi:polysaccharide deacetylase family protein, partial [Streptomyces sp. TRM64462]|uniref:polysaccharide deacetylase family protein n=1 Tax=Streptomyces sp. TRM64462 TaxID=2741726 RepID=UPI001586DD26
MPIPRPRTRAAGRAVVRTARAALAVLVPWILLTGFAPWPEPVPVVSRVPTDEPVVFLTIDDGWYHDPAAARLLIDRQVPASLFLLPGAYGYDSGYFRTLLDHGPSRVENHTLSHPDLGALDADAQRAEICGARDRHLAQFGDSPRLLRPPYGAYDEETRATARACGAKALVTWTHDFTTWGQSPPPAPALKAG